MAFSKELWVEIQYEYESGKNKSLDTMFDKIKKKLLKKYGKIPSIHSIAKKALNEEWNKYKHVEALKEAQHEKFMRIAREKNFGDGEMIDEILTMCRSDDMSEKNQGLQRYFDVTGVRAPHKIAKTDDTGESIEDRIIILPANGFEPTE